jgi:hypothetical protein
VVLASAVWKRRTGSHKGPTEVLVRLVAGSIFTKDYQVYGTKVHVYALINVSTALLIARPKLNSFLHNANVAFTLMARDQHQTL